MAEEGEEMSRQARIPAEQCEAIRRNGSRCTLTGRAIRTARGVVYLCGNHTGAAVERFEGYAERMAGL